MRLQKKSSVLINVDVDCVVITRKYYLWLSRTLDFHTAKKDFLYGWTAREPGEKRIKNIYFLTGATWRYTELLRHRR